MITCWHHALDASRSASPPVSPRKSGNVLRPGDLATLAFADSLEEAQQQALEATAAFANSGQTGAGLKTSTKRYAGYTGA